MLRAEIDLNNLLNEVPLYGGGGGGGHIPGSKNLVKGETWQNTTLK